jgi:polar amino acid transport system substrate-binding protein
VSAAAGRRAALALVWALAAAIAGCASVSDTAQDHSLAALNTRDLKPLPGLPVLDGSKACERDPYRSLAPGALPRPGHMPEGTFMRKIQRRGRLTVGVDQNSLGLGYFNPRTGKMEGFDIDVVRKVARAIFGPGNPDDHIRYRAISTQQREAAVYYRNVDMVASAFTNTCGRQRRMRFSTVYYRARQRLLVPESSDVNSLSDLKYERVCATRSSTTIANLVKTGVVAFPVELRSDCLVALQERDVAAVTSDDAILVGLCRQDPQTKIVGPPIKDIQHYGLAMDRRRRGFVRFVNAVLKRVDLDALSKRWLGDLAAQSHHVIRRCKIRGT